MAAEARPRGPPRFFFDTYALVERQQGNPAYEEYAGEAIFTHQMNLYEFIAAVWRVHGEGVARDQVRLLNVNLLEATTEDLFEAARVRADRPRQRLSYVDALGYVLARREGMRFLTGDQAFRGLVGVEFVK
jgi:predicted nucleic acid-binding protein